MAITAAQVKELREVTGAGMMDCKKALVECDGDMNAAKDWLRKKGISKAEKKEGRTAAEGLSKAAVCGNTAVVVEVNAETDFVAKNEMFLGLIDKTVEVIMNNKPATVEDALALTCGEGTLNDAFINAVAIIGEKIKLRRFEVIEKADDEAFGVYMHNGGAISAVAVVKGTDADLAKKIAMQVASMNPTYVSTADVPAEVFAHETEVQMALAQADPSFAKKPANIQEKIVSGKVSKQFSDVCLNDQEFFLEPGKKVGAYLTENGSSCVKFVKYKVGEGIEKKVDNFAAEVAAMAK